MQLSLYRKEESGLNESEWQTFVSEIRKRFVDAQNEKVKKLKFTMLGIDFALAGLVVALHLAGVIDIVGFQLAFAGLHLVLAVEAWIIFQRVTEIRAEMVQELQDFVSEFRKQHPHGNLSAGSDKKPFLGKTYEDPFVEFGVGASSTTTDALSSGLLA